MIVQFNKPDVLGDGWQPAEAWNGNGRLIRGKLISINTRTGVVVKYMVDAFGIVLCDSILGLPVIEVEQHPLPITVHRINPMNGSYPHHGINYAVNVELERRQLMSKIRFNMRTEKA